jgi:hypothetical protein
MYHWMVEGRAGVLGQANVNGQEGDVGTAEHILYNFMSNK